MADDPLIFVEVFAHHGRLRGGQLHKVSTDALKLITIGRAHPSARLILAFADETAAQSVKGTSWRAEALRTWSVEVAVVEIGAEDRARIEAAQHVQRMVNPPIERGLDQAEIRLSESRHRSTPRPPDP